MILLADEPTGNLDSKSGESVMELLHDLYMNRETICTVTHDPRNARHAQRNIYLFDGRVVDEPEPLKDSHTVSGAPGRPWCRCGMRHVRVWTRAAND